MLSPTNGTEIEWFLLSYQPWLPNHTALSQKTQNLRRLGKAS